MEKKKMSLYLKIALTAAVGAVFALTGQSAFADAATEMVNPKDKVLVGYWHNWASSGKDGYKQGTSANFDLSQTQEGYNVIDVSFMKTAPGQTIPTFKPYNKTDSEFRSEVASLNAKGKSVLIALGGADAHIELSKAQEEAFVKEIIRLVDSYGFDGLDIDLEQTAIDAADNKSVIPSALRKVKAHYRAQGQNFMITMAPEFPYLKDSGKYAPYIKGLEGDYDFINPQYYNQGGDGFWDAESNSWISQSNDEKKEAFLYGLTKRLATGTDGFIKIPADKLVIGLPANEDAAATGYVKKPQDVANALSRLKDSGNEIKGLMTWSVNWDAGWSLNGTNYNNAFVKTYAPMLFDNTGGGNESKPSLPIITISDISDTSAKIRVTSSDSIGIQEYRIKVGGQTYTSQTGIQVLTGLKADTTYQLEVTAVNKQGISSEVASASFKTTGGDVVAPFESWNKDKAYLAGDKVSYKGKNYEAKWWTKGDYPDQSGPNGPWKAL